MVDAAVASDVVAAAATIIIAVVLAVERNSVAEVINYSCS